jgi:hypothetical protein
MGKDRSCGWLEGFVERLSQQASSELKNALDRSPARFLFAKYYVLIFVAQKSHVERTPYDDKSNNVQRDFDNGRSNLSWI